MDRYGLNILNNKVLSSFFKRKVLRNMFYIKAKALELAEKALSIDEFDSSITVYPLFNLYISAPGQNGLDFPQLIPATI